MKTPIVSVFIPVYNGEKYLSETLRSLQMQTLVELEVIIVNDGSKDHTVDVARGIIGNDDRFQIISHDINKGPAAARNTGWRSCNPNSPYLMNHDCDDISLPTKLERLVSYLNTNPRIDAVGCFADYIDTKGNIIGVPHIHWNPRKIRSTFAKLNSMINSATLMRRKLVEHIAPYNSAYPSCDDYDFWARSLLAGFELANIPEVLHKIRIHPESIVATRGEELQSHVAVISKNYRKERRRNLFKIFGTRK
ncbi:MAG: glycosyltransferase family 2 protein [Bacteroidota bacterium]